MFVIPAVGFAFVVSFGFIALCYKYIFRVELTNGFEPVPGSAAVLQALLVGFFIPFFSAIIPILRVLGQNLVDALNFSRSRIKGTYVEIMKKSNMNIVPYLIFGMITFLYGLGLFYVMPLSLLSMKISLLLGVFLFILLGLIVGLTLLALNLQRFVEIGLTYLTLFWEKESMLKMILNNLRTHMQRNKLTSAIFSMSLAFNIFIMVQFRLIMLQQQETRALESGSFPYLSTNIPDQLTPEIFEPLMRKYSDRI